MVIGYTEPFLRSEDLANAPVVLAHPLKGSQPEVFVDQAKVDAQFASAPDQGIRGALSWLMNLSGHDHNQSSKDRGRKPGVR